MPLSTHLLGPHATKTFFLPVREASQMGCVAVAATVYFGGPGARRELHLVSSLFAEAHSLGMATILFSYLHPKALQEGGKDMIFSAGPDCRSQSSGGYCAG